jgi:hypothetical protein
MSVTTIVLSKDRPAQLDLLLRSIEHNGGGQFDPIVLWNGDPLGYAQACAPKTKAYGEVGGDFEGCVRRLLDWCGDFCCFMCDDGILYRHVPPLELDSLPDEVLCVSLRYGENTTEQYPTGFLNAFGSDDEPHETPEGLLTWEWKRAHGDYGYPGSVDAHVFRTEDVRRMLEPHTFPNPTALECALVEGCFALAAERPLMACYPNSLYVGNPINRVSLQSGVRFGTTFPVTAAECNERFQGGERIDLDALDFSGVNGAHTEIELVWK